MGHLLEMRSFGGQARRALGHDELKRFCAYSVRVDQEALEHTSSAIIGVLRPAFRSQQQRFQPVFKLMSTSGAVSRRKLRTMRSCVEPEETDDLDPHLYLFSASCFLEGLVKIGRSHRVLKRACQVQDGMPFL